MNTTEHSATTPRFWFWLAFAWVVILAKCLTVPWAIAHWRIPVAPGWVILPTLVLAVVATLLAFVRTGLGEPRG